MLSIAKKLTHSIFSSHHYSRLQKLLSLKTYQKQAPSNNTDNFVDIILDADFDKKGKIISLK